MLEFTFSEMLWQPMKSFRTAPGKTAKANAKLLIPQEEVERVMREVGPEPGPTGLKKLAAIKNIVEGWCAPAPGRAAGHPTSSRTWQATQELLRSCVLHAVLTGADGERRAHVLVTEPRDVSLRPCGMSH